MSKDEKRAYIVYLESRSMKDILGVFSSRQLAEDIINVHFPLNGTSGVQWHIIERAIIDTFEEF